ncbi:MAG: NusG domain II-containing protein [Spirochaetota bacterium]
MRRLKILDYLAFCATLFTILLFSLHAYNNSGTELQVYIQSPGNQWIYPLDSNLTINITGPLGDTIITIKDKKVWVVSAPCREKICVSSGTISKPGAWIACLPNRVFIRIAGKDRERIDAGTF